MKSSFVERKLKHIIYNKEIILYPVVVKEIKEYIDSKGKDFRLLFMIDEVGQYIGSDGSGFCI